MLLRGLREAEPSGQWVLWGPEEVGAYLWPAANHERSVSSPRARAGQSETAPAGDLVVYLHQIRPLFDRRRSITLIHDTIPLHYGSRAVRVAKRAFFKRAASLSTLVLSVSDHSKASIVSDLGVPPSRVQVLRYPYDPDFAAAVRGLRSEMSPSNEIFFLGRFAPHKNLERLVTAFGDTRFGAAGGRLRIVGGAPAEVSRLIALVPARAAGVSVERTVSEREVRELYAASVALVMPSLEEGFGLPVWEAITCGLPVCISSGGALPEITGGLIPAFDPYSVRQMTTAIDETVEGRRVPDLNRVYDELMARAPSISDFAGSFVDVVERGLAEFS